jgi:DNA modification methylase
MGRGVSQPEGSVSLEGLVRKFLPAVRLNPLAQTEIPRLAKDPGALRAVGRALREIPTHHRLYLGDSREMHDVDRESVHLVVTSPPYFDLKAYPDHEAQLGAYHDYEVFLKELDRVWEACRRVLVKGGRLIVIVGDVCRSRKAYGEHQVIPLHASIAHRCHQLGFNNLSTIVWHKIANAAFEVENGSSFLGKPYEPNAVIKNDIEYLLMLRKPGGYRRPTEAMRILSLISEKQHRAWFNQILRIPGASTRLHPAPYPMELAQRLIRMFSFVGDTVLDPFCGTGTTSVAAARSGRNSIGIEVEETYHRMAVQRLEEVAAEGVFRARVQSAHM